MNCAVILIQECSNTRFRSHHTSFKTFSKEKFNGFPGLKQLYLNWIFFPFGLLQMEDIGKAVMKYPGLLGTGINKIDRTIQFLKAAGVVEIAKCICRHPQVHLKMAPYSELSA